jgi:uncharacterized transporter YbjL
MLPAIGQLIMGLQDGQIVEELILLNIGEIIKILYKVPYTIVLA